MTILLVDDDPSVLAVLAAVLTREGYKVIAASSPLLALQLAARNAFSILITDFQMPEMDGFTLACRLAKSCVALPVLLMSGLSPGDIPLAELAERHWNFMSKPIDRERLLGIIDAECLGWALQMKA